MFEKKKRAFATQGKEWVELHITKPDGCKFAMIMEKRAYEKLSASKLQKIKNIMN